MRMKDDEWDAVIDTNLQVGVPPVARRAAPHDEGARRPHHQHHVGGRLVAATRGRSNYAAAKAGVAGMTRALAREIGSRGITVNCVAPGFIDTDMTKTLPEEQHTALQHADSAGPPGQPEDIAHAVAFPGVAASRLYHRHDAACERRHVHELTRIAAWTMPRALMRLVNARGACLDSNPKRRFLPGKPDKMRALVSLNYISLGGIHGRYRTTR